MTDNTGQLVPAAIHPFRLVFSIRGMILLRQNAKREEIVPVRAMATAILTYNQKRHLGSDALLFYTAEVISQSLR